MRLCTLITALMISFQATANESALLFGLNFASGNVTVLGSQLDIDAETGFQGGLRYLHGLGDNLFLRTGGEVRSLNGEFQIVNNNGEISLLTAYAPLTLQYMLSEQFGFFGGVGFSLLISDDCKVGSANCTNVDFDSFFVDAQIGATARLSDQFAAEFYYAIGVTDVADNAEINVIGLQAMYFFDY